ncbi:hypothetical protein, partial [Aeromonas veronii]
ARIREILISEPAWEEMTCLFALSLDMQSSADCFDVAVTDFLLIANVISLKLSLLIMRKTTT